MAENIEILIEETVNNFEIEIKDFSILKLISEDANNAIVLGEDGGLFADNNNQKIISWGEIEGTLSNQTDLQDALDLKANASELGATAFSNDYNDLENTPTLISNHSELNLDDGTNPHGTTKEDVGLGNVDNTSDINKPISTAVQEAFDNLEIPTRTSQLENDSNFVESTELDNYVPYTGATQDVDLGNNNLNAKGLKVNGTAGSGHLGLKHQSTNATAGGQETALFAGSDGELYYKNDGNTLSQIASRSWVNSQEFITINDIPTTDLDYVTSQGNTTENEISVGGVSTPLLNIKGLEYSSSIYELGFTENRIVYLPDSDGVIATEEKVQELIDEFNGTIIYPELQKKQDKLLFFKKANGIVSVTGTLSETQVFKQSFIFNDVNFGLNSYGLGFFLNIFSLFTKLGTASGYTIRVKLSTSSTMPSGSTDQIALYNGSTSTLYAPLRRIFSIIRPVNLGNMQLHGFPFTSSSINDANISTTESSSRDIIWGDSYYLYVSVQLTTSISDTLNFISLKASNV